MWTREMLKTEAKSFLKSNYFKAFLVSLLLLFVGSGSSGGSSSNTNVSTDFTMQEGAGFWQSVIESSSFGFLWGLGFTIILLLIVGSIAFRVFVGYHLEVGGRKFFVRGAEADVDLSHLTSSFVSGSYSGVLTSMLYRAVINFLYYLLLIIPGIIKSYAFSMVPYILADNPEIGYKRALELSEDMTSGHKWNMFVLDLSFIGWYLLGALAFGIGTLFVNPYVDATKAQLYLTLRKEAVVSSVCSADELKLQISLEDESESDDWYEYE